MITPEIRRRTMLDHEFALRNLEEEITRKSDRIEQLKKMAVKLGDDSPAIPALFLRVGIAEREHAELLSQYTQRAKQWAELRTGATT